MEKMISLKFTILPVIIAALVLLTACGLFSGCYTLKQGTAMLGYLNKAIPLEETGDEDFINLVSDIRSFAVNELGLKMSKNYTRYVQIDRNYLAAVVSASAKDSFKRHEWKYPVVGSMPYKGFFNMEDARKERAKLEKKDLDVWIRPVDAFSTLGWFKDPLYSYMRNYSKGRIAELIIHELVHATVFIKGQVQFNEELAEFIGTEGARAYIESRFGKESEEYTSIISSDTGNKNYISFIQELIAQLDDLYSQETGREEKLAKKEEIIDASKKRFEAEYDNLFNNDNYRGFITLPVNNAYLELYRLYYAEDDFFAVLFEKSGRDLDGFIAAAKTVSKKGSLKNNPRRQMEIKLLRL